MRGFDQLDDQDDGTVFRDVIMLALLGFVTIVVILLPHLNPPTRAQDIAAPGNIFVQATWPVDANDDVDLWVQAPRDRPVGYSNKGGKTFNLLRDDIGLVSDSDNANYEVAFSRGAPEGEYIVNLHLYARRSGINPLKVSLVVQLKGSGDSLSTIAKREISLVRPGEEITVIRFRLDSNGRLVKGSIHDLPYPLRNKQQETSER
jgi:hypothetical protein